MTVSLCHHSHCVLPPNGSIFKPGPCTNCGITWDAVQDELLRQERALIEGSARHGDCPDCGQHLKLYRYQEPSQPWDDFHYEPPISFLCAGCHDTAIDRYNDDINGFLSSI